MADALDGRGALICWTFVFKGSSPFTLHLDGVLGPGHRHQGPVSIWKFMGTTSEAREVEKEILRSVPGLHVKCYTETETEEMLDIRLRRLGLNITPATEGD